MNNDYQLECDVYFLVKASQSQNIQPTLHKRLMRKGIINTTIQNDEVNGKLNY